MEFQGFPRIHSIFYAVFDIIKGTVVKHQVPEGSVTFQNDSNSSKPLIDFEAISEYIIPKKQLYKRLVTICTNNYKVMGCPIVLHDHEKYQHLRNEFRFNVCFVFERDAETSSYEAVVRKLARVLEGLELECDFLSQDASLESRSVQNVIEQLFEDLNSYCECQIPINTFNTINLKLFPTYPNPPTVSDHQVPVCTVDLKKMLTLNWDITVQKIASHINGINHVKRIAELANVKPEWARQSMEHLLYYGCIIMTDIFQFSNVYAVRPEITRLLDDKTGLAQECLRYVVLPNRSPPPLSRIFALYCGLQYGLTVREWIAEHQVASLPIDVRYGHRKRGSKVFIHAHETKSFLIRLWLPKITRRFVSYGVIKGLIYRVHKYAVLTQCNPNEPHPGLPPKKQYGKIINRNTGTTIHPDIIPFLDGLHHYDAICTELKCSPQELDDQLGFRTNAFDLDTAGHSHMEYGHAIERTRKESWRENDPSYQWYVRFIYR